MMSGVNVVVRSPDAASLTHGMLLYQVITGFINFGPPVIQWAKKTGDYSVLSHPDLCILALTYALHEEERCGMRSGTQASHLVV